MASSHRDEIGRLELLHAAHPDGLVFPHLADAYRRAGRYAQAESVLKAGLRRHADYSSAHVVLGRLRLDQGKYEEAERAFLRVLELDPHNHVALGYLGRLSAEQGRLEEALEQFRRLARLKPGEEDVEEKIRELEQRVGELKRPRASTADRNGGAVQAAAVEPEVDPDEPPPSRLPEPGEVVTETMAELYARQGLRDRAAAVYRQLLERDPGNARLRAKLDAAQAAEQEGPGGAAATAAPDPATESGAHEAAPGDAAALATAPAPPARAPQRAAAPEPATIRTQLGGILAWRPDGEPNVAPELGAGTAPEPEVGTATVAEPEPEPAPLPDGEAGDGVEEAVPRPAPDRALWGAAPAGAPVNAATPEGDGGPAASASAEGGEASAVASSLIAITDMLVGLLEYRDPFFRGSSSLTRLVAEKVAEELGLSAAERLHLALAAVLRDLGRLALGGRLVSISGSRTPEARRRIERHVDLALHLLEGIELPRPVRLAVRHHHERWDGAGYPDALAAERIPRLARILAVVDAFTAMVSPRSYRLPRKVPDAARELQESAGTQFDPVVVEALLRVLARQDQPALGIVQRPHILLVNPDQPGAVVTAAKLCTAGYLAEVSSDPAAARERLRRVPVAGLVVSAEADEESAAKFVRELRVDPSFSGLPIVVVEAPTVAMRVRLLESGADVCFPPGTSHAELQGTLGALVRRSLRTGTAAAESDSAQKAPWLALQGDVEDFPLTWLLQVMKYDSRTAAIGIRTTAADGAIYLQNGDAVHAQIRGGAKGEAALRQMLRWEKGRFTVQPDARPRERTIRTSIMHLLLTQAVDQDHAAAGIFGAVSDES